jgi:hypothetical protein
MSDASAKPPAGDPTPPSPPDPLAERLQRAIRAHPVLRDQKKLQVVAFGGRVRLEGQVFTLDMRRQVDDLLARLPGGDEVQVEVAAEIAPPGRRPTTGNVPPVSPGPSPVDRAYSTGHLQRRRRLF